MRTTTSSDDSRQTDPPAPADLLAVVQEVHRSLRAGLAAAAAPAPPGDPRAPVRALDATLGELCGHLGAAEDVLHRSVRQLPGGKQLTAGAATTAHDVDRRLRSVQQTLSGGSTASHASPAELVGQLRDVLEEHCAAEEELARRLDAALDPDRRAELGERLRTAGASEPTRPHPHLPHSGPLAGPARRLAARWDDVLDVLDVRQVPGRRAAPAPQRSGRWGSYLTARPLADDAAEQERPRG